MELCMLLVTAVMRDVYTCSYIPNNSEPLRASRKINALGGRLAALDTLSRSFLHSTTTFLLRGSYLPAMSP